MIFVFHFVYVTYHIQILKVERDVKVCIWLPGSPLTSAQNIPLSQLRLLIMNPYISDPDPFFSMYLSNFLITIYWRHYPFPHCRFLAPLCYINYLIVWVSFRVLYCVSLIYESIFLPVPYCFNYYGFVM